LIEQLPATALQAWLADDRRAKPLIVDVRESWEHAICKLPDASLIPMQQIPARIDELPRDRDIVVVCHHGMRSYQVAEFLTGAGFTRLYNLAGGIAAWSTEVDPQVPQY
jgi:rhodanese-related sulfurtransferase